MRMRRLRGHGTAPLLRHYRAGHCAGQLHAKRVAALGRDPLCVCGDRRHAFEVWLGAAPGCCNQRLLLSQALWFGRVPADPH